jgi:hypothetical protein
MAFYTQATKTNLIDPRISQNNRLVEFRFDSDTTYLSNMRLLNVAIKATAGKFNVASGISEVIEEITLYDGNTQLDQIRHFPLYSAFKNYMKDNASNRAIHGFLTGNNLGYEVQSENTQAATEKLGTTFAQKDYDPTNVSVHGWLDLKYCLPFLQAMPVVPTQLFKNLRLVINFKQPVLAGQSTETPLLVADSMGDPAVANQLASQYKGGSYVSVEHDSVYVPAFTTGLSAPNDRAVQSVSNVFKGFDNKTINRCVIVKEVDPSVESQYVGGHIGRLGSQLYLEESEQLRINGRQQLVTPMDTPAKSLAALSDVYGTANAFANRLKTSQVESLDILNAQCLETQGKQDYRAFNVRQRIDEFLLDFKRTCEYDAKASAQGTALQNAPLTLHVFAECPKSIQVSGSNYLIGYVN